VWVMSCLAMQIVRCDSGNREDVMRHDSFTCLDMTLLYVET